MGRALAAALRLRSQFSRFCRSDLLPSPFREAGRPSCVVTRRRAGLFFARGSNGVRAPTGRLSFHLGYFQRLAPRAGSHFLSISLLKHLLLPPLKKKNLGQIDALPHSKVSSSTCFLGHSLFFLPVVNSSSDSIFRTDLRYGPPSSSCLLSSRGSFTTGQ